MNILILNWRDIKNPKSGGAEIVTMEHAKAWVKAGHKVTWFTSNFRRGKKNEEVNGVETIRFGNFITVYLFAPFFYFFSKGKFDIVIDEIHGIPFFTPLYVRKPKIVLIHEVAAEIWDYMWPFPINKIGKFIEPFYFKLYNNIQFWAPSDSTIEDLVKNGIDRKNCVKIMCAINNKVLSKPKVKEKQPTFIFVSRLVKMKGIEDVIESFGMINKTLNDSNLWIVGEGDKGYTEFLKKKAEKLGLEKNIKFFGFVPNRKKLELMSRAHLLLHASIKEGWGLVVIEAASQATPAIVYNVPGLSESVVDRKTGIVVKKNSPLELANEAVGLLENKKKYGIFQRNCLNWAKSLTWDKSTKASLYLLESIVKN